MRGEFTGESLDFRDFSAIVLTIPMPPKEKNECGGGGFAWVLRTKKEPRNGEFLSPFAGRYWGVDMFKIGATGTANVSVRRITHALARLS